MKKVLVTGGCGFIGSNIVNELLNKKGYEVTVIDDLSLGVASNIPKSKRIKLITDISIGNTTDITIPKGIEEIYHLGTPSSSPMYKENPHLVSQVVNGMISLLEYCRKNDAKMVYASSSSVYNTCPLPYSEWMDIVPTDYYTESKYYQERLSEVYYRLYGVESVGLRLFSVYGIPETHKGKYANLVTQFILCLSKNEQPIIYGDGSQTRDFIFVSDVVNAFLLAMNSQDVKSGVFNVGTGKNYSLNEVIKIINSISKAKLTPKYLDNPISNYVKDTLADTTKAQHKLRFIHSVELPDGIYYLMSKLCPQYLIDYQEKPRFVYRSPDQQ